MIGVAIIGVVIAVLAYRLAFLFIKARWGLPALFNSIGAIFMAAGAFTFWQAITNDVGDAYNFPMPDVPISVPATYIMISIIWYVVTIKIYVELSCAAKSVKKH